MTQALQIAFLVIAMEAAAISILQISPEDSAKSTMAESVINAMSTVIAWTSTMENAKRILNVEHALRTVNVLTFI